MRGCQRDWLRSGCQAGLHMARLLSVNVGLPREITWRGKTVYTSVWKEPVQGRHLVRRLNIDGDAQGDLAGHGGLAGTGVCHTASAG